VEINEFHWTDGWYFKRNDDGSVRIRKRTVSSDEAPIVAEATIPAFEWVSIASHCTAEGDDCLARLQSNLETICDLASALLGELDAVRSEVDFANLESDLKQIVALTGKTWR